MLLAEVSDRDFRQAVIAEIGWTYYAQTFTASMLPLVLGCGVARLRLFGAPAEKSGSAAQGFPVLERGRTITRDPEAARKSDDQTPH